MGAARSPDRKRAVLGFLVLLLITPGLLFLTAGTIRWPVGWAYVAVVVAGSGAAHLLVAWKNPDTLRERARGFRVEGAQRWDRWLVPAVVWGPVIAIVVAGLDHRLGWSTLGPSQLQLAGLVVAAGAYALGAWAMAVNPFFAAVARLQSDRGQTVIRTGPYRIVRHPGYAAAALATLTIPVILDSAWAILPAGSTVALLVARTALEDRMLRDGLEGYRAYASSTRHRLMPGLW